MKSISDIRRDNLIEIIRNCFNNKQTRIAEAMGVQQSIVHQRIRGHIFEISSMTRFINVFPQYFDAIFLERVTLFIKSLSPLRPLIT